VFDLHYAYPKMQLVDSDASNKIYCWPDRSQVYSQQVRRIINPQLYRALLLSV
jgi:hypothetical protein